jgi:hypothetical protein
MVLPSLTRRRLHSNKHASFRLVLEFYMALNQGKDGVIFAHADVSAWVPLGATLANDNVARDDFFATKFLDAKTAAGSIATVAGTSTCFFMCHLLYSSVFFLAGALVFDFSSDLAATFFVGLASSVLSAFLLGLTFLEAVFGLVPVALIPVIRKTV